MPSKFKLPAKRIDIHNHLWNDPEGDKLIELMDQAGVEMTLILGLNKTFFEAQTQLGTNDQVVKAMRKHPGRLIGGCYADPREGAKAIEQVRRYHADGCTFVKLFPNYGYFPDDEQFIPFFDAVAELNMGVLSHCGWLGGRGDGMSHERWAAYYSHPGRFEMVMRTHPKTPFIMAHMGGLAGWLDTIMLTTRAGNCYVDCSPGQGREVLQKGGPMAGSVPPTKLLYGADGYNVSESIPEYAGIMAAQGYGPHFDKIFYANSRGILEQVGAVAKQAPPPAETPVKQAARGAKKKAKKG